MLFEVSFPATVTECIPCDNSTGLLLEYSTDFIPTLSVNRTLPFVVKIANDCFGQSTATGFSLSEIIEEKTQQSQNRGGYFDEKLDTCKNTHFLLITAVT